MDLGTKPTATSQDDWDKLEMRGRSTIRLCLSETVLLNISSEYSVVNIWGRIGSLYQSKSLVKKKNLQKKLFHLRMDENDTIIERLNVYNIMVS